MEPNCYLPLSFILSWPLTWTFWLPCPHLTLWNQRVKKNHLPASHISADVTLSPHRRASTMVKSRPLLNPRFFSQTQPSRKLENGDDHRSFEKATTRQQQWKCALLGSDACRAEFFHGRNKSIKVNSMNFQTWKNGWGRCGNRRDTFKLKQMDRTKLEHTSRNIFKNRKRTPTDFFVLSAFLPKFRNQAPFCVPF